MQATLLLDESMQAAIDNAIKLGVIEAVQKVQAVEIKPYMTKKETCAFLGIHESTFKKHFTDKGLPMIEFGDCKRVALSDLTKFMEQLKTYNFEE